jgi:hypothetical protein
MKFIGTLIAQRDLARVIKNIKQLGYSHNNEFMLISGHLQRSCRAYDNVCTAVENMYVRDRKVYI